MPTFHFNGANINTLRNALSVARDRYAEDSKNMGQIADEGGSGMVSIAAARELESQFNRQVEEVDAMLVYLDSAAEEADA